MTEFLRRIARSNSWWVALRRAQREGWGFTLQRLRTWPRVLRSTPVRTGDGNAQRLQCEVHSLCSQRDYLTAMWALKSFYAQVGDLSLPLTIHFDKALPSKISRHLRQHFPDARIIGRPEADAVVEPILEQRKLLRLATARKASPFILKLTDFTLLANAPNIICFDSDVLFFARPDELLQAASDGFDGAMVQTDLGSTYNIDFAHAQAMGWRLPERVNTGIMAFARSAVDLEACDQLLADADLARATGWIEQTLFALSFERTAALRFLPPTYVIPVAGERMPADGVVARHYAGQSRPLLTLEGMPLILKQR